jgi:hypothetical protein
MRVSRRGLQVALGVLWLLDGALQLQPVMFTRAFATQIIAPAGSGQPGFVHAAVSFAASVIGSHPVPADVLVAVVQLGLGAGLLWPRTSRIALPASAAWAAGVWIFGEGLGGLLGGRSGLLTGAPGAAILYAVLALAAWPGATAAARPPARWLRPAWAVVWTGAAVLQLLPGQVSGRAVASAFTGSVAGVPGPLVSASRALGGVAAGHGVATSVILAVLFAGVGVAAVLSGRWPVAAAACGVVLAVGVWALAEGFGGIGTGQATDPDTGPLMALFAVAMWSAVPGRPLVAAEIGQAPAAAGSGAPATAGDTRAAA